MRKFLKENNFNNIDFLYNNSYLIEDKIIVGTRGWLNTWKSQDNYKILKRENERLKLSINSGKKQFGEEKEMIALRVSEEKMEENADKLKARYGIQ